ncbi:MAG: ABC transporter ATP-binding protein [Desulfobulbus sp.]
MTQLAIEIVQLSKVFKGKKRAMVEALQCLDLSIAHGEIVGFLGPNGAGKSTTIKILTGQIWPTSGTIRLNGRPVTAFRARETVGYLPENPSFYRFLTAREYLRFVGQIFKMPSKYRENEIDRILDLLGLVEAADRPLKGFSKGMTQRLGLAQTLLHDPALYILDEPMSGLDPVGRALIKDILRSLKQRGKTVFFSTHIISDVEALCDRAAIIVHGRLAAIADVHNDFMQASAYLLQVRNAQGVRESLIVPADQVSATVQRFLGQGATLEQLEPQEKNLENVFLHTVETKGR